MARKPTKVVDLRNARRESLEVAYAATPTDDPPWLREKFLKVALIAEIPPENVDAFLNELADHVATFQDMLVVDHLRSQRKAAINVFVNAADRMICAIECVQRYEKTEITEHTDLLFHTYLRLGGIPHSRRGSGGELGGMGIHTTGTPSLAGIKRELTVLHDNAKFLSTVELPKRGENRTKILLKNIWLTAEKFGGGLTYDKHSHRGGTLLGVVEFFSGLPGWTKLSRSTLDRLRPR